MGFDIQGKLLYNKKESGKRDSCLFYENTTEKEKGEKKNRPPFSRRDRLYMKVIVVRRRTSWNACGNISCKIR